MFDTITAKDVTSFTVSKRDVTTMEVASYRETSKSKVPECDGLDWWVRWYPAGDRDSASGHLSLFLFVSKPVTAKLAFLLGSSVEQSSCEVFTEAGGRGFTRFASHEKLFQLFRKGKVNVTCNVEFDITGPSLTPRVFESCGHVPTDCELIVGGEKLKVHKSFLSLMSPTFHAMFFDKTNGACQVDVPGFTFNTVKASIDFLYGRGLPDLSVDAVVDVLRFADKYDIKGITTQLKSIPSLGLSVDTFCPIMHFAYDCNKTELLEECQKFYVDHEDEIKTKNKFATLPTILIVSLLQDAFDLATLFDVIQHAFENGIDFLVANLEKPLIESLTLKDFCPAVRYAWSCSRDDLKQACAIFMKDHRNEILELEAYFDLPQDYAYDVLKSGFILNHSDL